MADATAAFGAPDGADVIRDIKGPLPPATLSPFATIAVAMLAVAAVVFSRRPPLRQREAAAPASAASLDELVSLRQLYLDGEVAHELVYDRLSEIVRHLLPVENGPSLTDSELLMAAAGLVAEETLQDAALLLQRCEAVRFGKHRPSAGIGLKAVDDAIALLKRLGEGR